MKHANQTDNILGVLASWRDKPAEGRRLTKAQSRKGRLLTSFLFIGMLVLAGDLSTADCGLQIADPRVPNRQSEIPYRWAQSEIPNPKSEIRRLSARAEIPNPKSEIRNGPAVSGRPVVVDASRYSDLQKAFLAVPEGGGLVKLPPGDFLLTRPLILTRENTRIEGAGAATHLINRNKESQPAFIIRPASRLSDRQARIWRVQLADFRISGNPKSGDGVRAEGVNEIYIHGMSVDHNGGHGINLIDCYEDPRICDSIITYNGDAGLNILSGHDIVVNGNQFEENRDAVRCIDSFNLCMNGNNLDDHLRHGVVIENTYGSVLSGNMIEECRGTAVVLDRDCYGITISANVIAHNSGGGVDLRDAWGCAVSANTFTIVAQRAVAIGPGSGRITVTGNNFSNAHIGPGVKRDDPATGVTLAHTSDVVISGNVFTGLAAEAIKAEGECKRIVIVGNAMSDLSRSALGRATPAMDLSGAEAVVKDNAVEKESPAEQ